MPLTSPSLACCYVSRGSKQANLREFQHRGRHNIAKTMTESLKDVFKPVLSLPIIPTNDGSLLSLSSPKQHENSQKSKAKIHLSIWLSNGITTMLFIQ